MKKTEIKRILDELDGLPLPSKKKILSACPAAEKKRIYKTSFKRSAVLIAVVFAILLAAAGCAAEAKEYNDAISFFEEHELSIENLSRSEIKKVYRDIKTERFELEKTASVILNSYEGYEIGVTKPTSEELKNIWEELRINPKEKYSWYYLDNDITVDDIPHSGEIIFRKAINGSVIWETKIPLRDAYVKSYTLSENSEYIAAYGSYSSMTGNQQCGFIEVLKEDSGESVLRKIFDEYRFFSIAEVFPCGDELIIFSRAELEKLVFMKMDLSGKILYKKETETGNRGIWDVAKFGDGYIVQLGGYQTQEAIFKVTADGELGEGFSYDSEDTAYFICDMMEYEGKLYLSAYAVPKHGSDIQTSHDETTYILEKILGNSDDGFKMPDTDELLELLYENYTAVLLVCDANDGIPEVFYSVAGSVCGELSETEDGMMLWETEYISDAYYSPATSAFSIGGACHVYKHTFDKDGNIIASEKTGEVTSFMK